MLGIPKTRHTTIEFRTGPDIWCHYYITVEDLDRSHGIFIKEFKWDYEVQKFYYDYRIKALKDEGCIPLSAEEVGVMKCNRYRFVERKEC